MTELLSSPPVHLILVGLPGSGKTSVGRGVARRTGRDFLDFDAEIERRTGHSIAQLFEQLGEAHFRQLELDLTAELAPREGMILAPGGGWIMVPGALAMLRPPGRVIYLRTTPAVAYRRMGAGHRSRPLLAAADPLHELSALLAARERSYLSADFVVDVELLDLQDVITMVARFVASPQAQ
ncbi:MAG: shikimate kinase [Gemmatimonadaceae bacterium]